MPTSDEELAKLQTSVGEKRQRLADARRERELNERALANDITAAQLLAESTKLDLLIAKEEKSSSEDAVGAGAATLMAQVKPEPVKSTTDSVVTVAAPEKTEGGAN